MQRKARYLNADADIGTATGVLSSPKERPADRADVITNSIGIKLVRIPAGDFVMGADEGPVATMAAFPYAI